MVSTQFSRFVADDRSYFALIKKDIHRMVADAGFAAVSINNIDIIVAELTSNLHKYATGGAEILARLSSGDGDDFIELLSIDNGPGIHNMGKVLEDHFSSSNTLGHGLGSIRRLSDVFDIYSAPGWGTISLVRVFKNLKKNKPTPGTIRFGGLLLPKPGETVSGDGYHFRATRNGFAVMLADGLGHGKEAHEAVRQATSVFQSAIIHEASGMIRDIHNAIRKTRGAVINVYIFNATQKNWHVCGVGNIATKFIGGIMQKNYIPYNGIVGHNIPNTLNDVILKKEEYNHFVACSDGIKSRWDLTRLGDTAKKDPLILSAAIYKEFARQTDDMSVVSCKIL